MSRVDEIKSRTVFPKKPAIRKQGTISCNCIVETTPIVYRGELYRFEVVRRKSFTSATKGSWHDVEDSPCLRFVKVRTNEATPIFAEDHTFGFPIVVGDKMYVVTGKSKTWGADTLVFMRSDDLVSWEIYQELPMPGFKIYNMNIAQKDGKYTLLIEISAPLEECGSHPYTFRFLQSDDMTHWTLMPKECVFQKDRYAGSPGLYTLDDDPYYYVTYLEEYPMCCYANCIARSKDFINWEYSLLNPVLMYDEYEDKKIASPFLTMEDRALIDAALDINNSDMEICEFLGRTIIYYSWGDQLGHEFLAEACYEGTVKEFLQGFFE
ncbi:MAG: hypothetical protein E7403_03475 [Ruminococcaceae bacterium]|nr:hypothetical protein [Oscillospiraceae bacterium]